MSLLKSLKNIYESSNFYKETRIVSFIDRLHESIIAKIKAKMSINISIVKGKKEFEKYDQEIQYAMSVITKFRDVSIIEILINFVEFFHYRVNGSE